MNLSVYDNIPKYNQNFSSYQEKKSIRRSVCHNCTWLLNNAPTNLSENKPKDFI